MSQFLRYWKILLGCFAVLSAVPGTAYCANNAGEPDIFSGYYSREQNDGDIARASRKSHYIRFYPENRIVRLFIPFPYAKSVPPEIIRQVFDRAIKMTTRSAYISDDFGLLKERVVVNVDFIKHIDGEFLFDCEKSTPCRIEFNEHGMRVIQAGLVTGHVINYDLVPD